MIRYLLVCILVSTRGHQANGACVCDSVDTEVHPNAGLLPDACGVGDGEIEEKGHGRAGLYEFPWMALIFYETEDGRDFRCAGTIINSRYILTAANCIKNNYENITGVRVGEYNMCTSIDCQLDQCESHIQDIPVDEAIVHENYTSQVNYIDNDIALLRLHDPIDFTFKNVAPICLPVSNALRIVSIDGKTATIASWKFRHTKSCALNKISLPLVTTDECVNKYKTSKKIISINHICADEKEEDCYNIIAGDPLMLDAGDERGRRMVQYGISSHGPTRCRTDYPGVYTNVSKYMDWILSNLKK